MKNNAYCQYVNNLKTELIMKKLSDYGCCLQNLTKIKVNNAQNIIKHSAREHFKSLVGFHNVLCSSVLSQYKTYYI